MDKDQDEHDDENGSLACKLVTNDGHFAKYWERVKLYCLN